MNAEGGGPVSVVGHICIMQGTLLSMAPYTWDTHTLEILPRLFIVTEALLTASSLTNCHLRQA